VLQGIAASNATTTTILTVVENTPTVHNLIVCTLCSVSAFQAVSLQFRSFSHQSAPFSLEGDVFWLKIKVTMGM